MLITCFVYIIILLYSVKEHMQMILLSVMDSNLVRHSDQLFSSGKPHCAAMAQLHSGQLKHTKDRGNVFQT